MATVSMAAVTRGLWARGLSLRRALSLTAVQRAEGDIVKGAQVYQNQPEVVERKDEEVCPKDLIQQNSKDSTPSSCPSSFPNVTHLRVPSTPSGCGLCWTPRKQTLTRELTRSVFCYFFNCFHGTFTPAPTQMETSCTHAC
ncbi:uncharacterized protein MONBRDRAFT_28153 [Monosiga brevicollis MX1]|uniref:Uncharacterized protein n=1 Tax=Monosiga brevicollis TaxID=81824 RepID=A9V7C8_MONBE|nr:uncharacterized protein MONBRDRAFT_28153 [Monosiga brevicollis MX1]EDQ86563.1 predicted protein [Monosiga brevicollis MX1]|eukprot:XP_001748676.1 hypothetical protein [Monosiga brevicollis MX1]